MVHKSILVTHLEIVIAKAKAGPYEVHVTRHAHQEVELLQPRITGSNHISTCKPFATSQLLFGQCRLFLMRNAMVVMVMVVLFAFLLIRCVSLASVGALPTPIHKRLIVICVVIVVR